MTVEDLQGLVASVLTSFQLRLIEVKLLRGRRIPLIQLYIDRENGPLTIDDCAMVSRRVQDLIDMQYWSPPNYRLEVSSPGIDRPLFEPWQFRKNIGRHIRLTGRDGEILGRIVAVTPDGIVRLETEDQTRGYQADELSGAKVVTEKPKPRKGKRK